MKTLFMTLILLSLQTTFAGVAEKKAIVAGDTEISEYTKKMNTACGGKITVKSNHVAAQKTPEDGRDGANMITTAASVCASRLSNLASLCGDADYKEEIAKLTTVVCEPDSTLKKNPYVSVTNKGNVLTIKHNPITDGSSSAYDAIKAAF